MYLRGVTRSTMYQKLYLKAGTGIREISTVASGPSPIKIHYFDYPKRFIHRTNEVYDFSRKKQKTSFITVCFAAITLVIVLTWFL